MLNILQYLLLALHRNFSIYLLLHVIILHWCHQTYLYTTLSSSWTISLSDGAWKSWNRPCNCNDAVFHFLRLRSFVIDCLLCHVLVFRWVLKWSQFSGMAKSICQWTREDEQPECWGWANPSLHWGCPESPAFLTSWQQILHNAQVIFFFFCSLFDFQIYGNSLTQLIVQCRGFTVKGSPCTVLPQVS